MEENLTLKIEAESPEDLIELQEYILENLPDLMITETYGHAPGFNKEPVIASIIIALGGKKILIAVQGIIKSFLEYRLKSEKEANRHEEKMYQLSIKSNTKHYRSVTKKDFMELTIN